ncbi:MAG: hypothetical protein RLP44_11085 [Aggregatilineales bacterium]
MNITAHQIWGMAKYEFKMHWRRRALLVLTLSMILILVAPIFLSGDLTNLTNVDGVSEENVEKALSLSVAIVTWFPLSSVLIFILPVALADTIPLDKQYNVDELLRTTPLTPAVYLWGKLIGTWLATLSSVFIVMIIATIAWISQVGKFDYVLYAEIWLVNAFSITILNGSLGVLLAVGQPNRRRAIVVVIGLFALLVFVLGFDFGEYWNLASPARMPMLTYFIPIEGQEELITTVFNRQVMLSILMGFVELLIIWLAAWGWLKYQDNNR